MEKERIPQFEIRKATLDDVEPIRRMHAQSWRDTYENDELGLTKEWLETTTNSWLTPEALADSNAYFEEMLEDSSQFYRVAVNGKEIAGFIHVKANQDETFYLSGFYVAKHAQGTGLAHRMMEQADTWIGTRPANLKVATYNERAKAFYRKHGFQDSSDPEGFVKDIIPVMSMKRPGRNP